MRVLFAMKRITLVLLIVGCLGCEGRVQIESSPGGARRGVVSDAEVIEKTFGHDTVTFCSHGNRVYQAIAGTGVALAVVPNDPSCATTLAKEGE